LFDSIYRGYPLGTLLLWERPASGGRARFGPIEIAAEDETSAYWVVDGQQRITSLVGALAANAEGVDERFEVYFDVRARRFLGPNRGSRPYGAVPVREMLESRRLLAWLRENGTEFDDDELETIDAVAGAIRDYKIPAYIVTDSN